MFLCVRRSWVTGAVAATTNNGVGIASIPQTVTVIPCRYLDSTGNGQVSDGLRCWSYCMAQGSHVGLLFYKCKKMAVI